MENEKRPIDQYLMTDEEIRKFFEQGRQLVLNYPQPPRPASPTDESQVA